MSGISPAPIKVAVICGGVGAARFLMALQYHCPDAEIVGIVNVADDMELHGLHISPDLDTITYSLAGQINTQTGWGMTDETWRAMGELRAYGEALTHSKAPLASEGVVPQPTDQPSGQASDTSVSAGAMADPTGWFSLGDRDLGTHLYRTSRLHQGATLTEVTREITSRWGLDVTLLPVTNDPVRTFLETVDGTVLSFQEYFVRERHSLTIKGVEFRGIDTAVMTPEVQHHLSAADIICIAPSNPVVSIDPVISVPGVRELLQTRRDHVVAISPIIGGQALKGPAAQLLDGLGYEPNVVTVGKWYSDIISELYIDTVDAELAPEIEKLGLRCVVTDTMLQPVTRPRDLINAITSTGSRGR